MSKATNAYRANVVTVNLLQIGFDPHDPMVGFIGVSIRITGKKSIGGNTHFCLGESAVLQYSSFETFLLM